MSGTLQVTAEKRPKGQINVVSEPSVPSTVQPGQAVTIARGEYESWRERTKTPLTVKINGVVVVEDLTGNTYTVPNDTPENSTFEIEESPTVAGNYSITRTASGTVAGLTIVEFGADTIAGQGGYAVTQTSVTDDGGTGLEVAAGTLRPATTGVTAGTVTLDDGMQLVVQTVANAQSVANHQQLRLRLEDSSLTRGTSKVLLRAGTVFNEDGDPGRNLEVKRTAAFQGTVGYVEVTGHSNEPRPVIRSITFNTQEGRPENAWVHFHHIDFLAQFTGYSGFRSHILGRGKVNRMKVTDNFFGSRDPEVRGEERLWYDGIEFLGSTANQRWIVTDNRFEQVYRAATVLKNTYYARNVVDKVSKDAHQFIDTGSVIEYNEVRNFRKPFSIYDIASVETSPANANWTRFYIPGHNARTKGGSTGFDGLWDTSFVLENLDPALETFERRNFPIQAGTDDYLDVAVDTSGADQSLFAGGEVELSAIHSDVFQTASANPGAADSPAQTMYGYDNVYIGNHSDIGDIPKPYQVGLQHLFLRSNLGGGASPPFADYLIAFNTGAFASFHGISVEDANSVVAIHNVSVTGESNRETTFIKLPGSMTLPDDSIVAGCITNDLQPGNAENVFNNREVTLAEMQTVFENPTYWPNQVGGQTFRDNYSVKSAVAALYQGSEGTGLYDFTARTAMIPPYMGKMTFTENASDYTARVFCADQFATLNYIIVSDTGATYTNSEIQNATVGGSVLEVGTMTAAEAKAGKVVGGALTETLFRIHVSAVNNTPVAIDPKSAATVQQEALDWQSAVAAAQGAPVSDEIMFAVSDYIKTAKETTSRVGTTNWDEHGVFVPLVGPDTLVAALGNPVKGTAYTQTATGFVEADYDPTAGLQGASGKHIDTGFSGQVFGDDRMAGLFHLGPRVDSGVIFGNVDDGFGVTRFQRRGPTAIGTRCQSNGFISHGVTDAASEGVYGWGRYRPQDVDYVVPGEQGSIGSQTSNGGPVPDTYLIGAVRDDADGSIISHTACTFQTYIVGGGINMTTMQPALAAMVAAIRAALGP